MVFIDRRPRKEDRWLTVKLWCFTVGAALALLGVYLERDWLIWTAVTVLLAGFGARFLGRRTSGTDGPAADGRGAEEPEPQRPDSPAGG